MVGADPGHCSGSGCSVTGRSDASAALSQQRRTAHRQQGSSNSNGNAAVQTFAWASWVRPGTYPRVSGQPLPTDWALQDIHAISHEIAEWGDDSFVNNWVEPWATPTAPQYGCTNILETGDPVVGIGFAKGTNTFEQGALPDGEQMADGYYHPEDEVFLPWFMRLSPNRVSEPTQSPSANVGRYTLMGDLNPFPGSVSPQRAAEAATAGGPVDGPPASRGAGGGISFSGDAGTLRRQPAQRPTAAVSRTSRSARPGA
jgi:hypothetical protein